MNKTLAEARAFAEGLLGAGGARAIPRIQRFVIPPFTAVREVKAMLSATSVKVGAQNMHWADAGAWTGEISPPMLKDCGLDLVELGHSERREHFGETDETVGLKTQAAVRHGLIPLICVGETLRRTRAGRRARCSKRRCAARWRGSRAPQTQRADPARLRARLGDRRQRRSRDVGLCRRAAGRDHRGRGATCWGGACPASTAARSIPAIARS